jgi:hypothetical protein
MPRPPRAFVEGIYHISSHGSDARRLFLGDGDRATFLARLAVILERFELRLVAYTLLGNHYHLVLMTPDERVSKAFQQLHTWYSRWHNLIHGRSAHLFSAHFFARELASDADLLPSAATSPTTRCWPDSPATRSAGAGAAPPRPQGLRGPCSPSMPARFGRRLATPPTGRVATARSSRAGQARPDLGAERARLRLTPCRAAAELSPSASCGSDGSAPSS